MPTATPAATRRVVGRLLGPSRKSAGAEQVVFTFLASSGVLDRQREKISADAWERPGWRGLDAYRRNPVILAAHRYDSLDHVIGRALDVRATAAGLEADIRFNDTPNGRLAHQLVAAGDLRGVSVGFVSHASEPDPVDRGVVVHRTAELLEVSVVAIPANPEALRLRAYAPRPGAPVAERVADQLALLYANLQARRRRALVEDAVAAALADIRREGRR